MNKKEQMFCRAYAALNNLKEAAIHAGYPANEAQRTAETLIAREDIARAVRQFSSHTNDSLCDRAVAGLLRLAFGNADDCVRLAFSDDEPNLSEMNLFNISEIKRPKGGGLEIKFADRMKALALLYEIGRRGEEDEACSFFEALEASSTDESGTDAEDGAK